MRTLFKVYLSMEQCLQSFPVHMHNLISYILPGVIGEVLTTEVHGRRELDFTINNAITCGIVQLTNIVVDMDKHSADYWALSAYEEMVSMSSDDCITLNSVMRWVVKNILADPDLIRGIIKAWFNWCESVHTFVRDDDIIFLFVTNVGKLECA